MIIDDIIGYQPFWGEWVIDEQIGKGSFGRVYRIKRQDYTFVNQAALKVICVPKDMKEREKILSETGSVEGARSYCTRILDNLLNEIKLMNRFKGNSNIVSMEDYKVIEAGEGDFGFALLMRMELCKTVNDYINLESDYFKNTSELVRMGVSLCDALTVMHSNSVLHMDIKPGNIMVSMDGKYKLGDFGMAKSKYIGEENPQIAGTYDYMAPEVYNHFEYDARADIYSLGLTLYYYANGLRGPYLENVKGAPSSDDKAVALTRRIKNERMQAPFYAPDKIAAVILRACAFNPNDRFYSAQDFKAALIGAAASESVKIPSVSGYMSGSVNMISGSISGSIASPYPSGSSGAPAQFEKDKSGKKTALTVASVAAGLLLVAIVSLLLIFKVFGTDEKEDGKVEPTTVPSVPTEAVTPSAEPVVPTDAVTPSPEPDIVAPVIIDDEMYYPQLKSEITVMSDEEYIYKGTSSDSIKVEAQFVDGEDIVEGEIMLEGRTVIEQSGEYNWRFEPFLNEIYYPVEGKVYITAFERDMINGLEEYNKIENKAEILYLSLEGESLKDVLFLGEAVNLEKLNLDSNELESLDGLEKCTHLKSLAFNDNPDLKDISAVMECKELTKVYSDSTGVETAQLMKLQEVVNDNKSRID